QAERGISPHTVSAYLTDMADVASFLKEGFPQASAEDIRRYLHHLHRQGLSEKTRARRISSLRQYYRFLVSDGQRQDNPLQMIDAPKMAKTLPKYLSPQEVERLLATSHRLAVDEETIRLAALLELLYATGMRI